MYDIIIVGAGIAGLYAAHKIQILDHTKKILVLEQSPKEGLGGRARNKPFQGASVAIGAGVGRLEKDRCLYRLLQEFEIPTHTFPAKAQYAVTTTTHDGPCNVKQMFSEIRRQYNSKSHPPLTFREFAEPLLGKDLYRQFTTCAGYTDYENEDVQNTLYNYGFEDNYEEWTGFSVPWSTLVQAIVTKIKSAGCKIRTSCAVSKIRPIQQSSICGFDVLVQTGRIYQSKQVIMATTIESVLHLVPGALDKTSPYRDIHGQAFMRIYGRFSKACIPIVRNQIQTQTIVPGPLHKLIPIQPEKGIYMIAYTDNEGAKTIRNYCENTAKNREALCRLLERALGLSRGTLELVAIQGWFWSIGTHYYAPLQPPYRNRTEFIRHVQRPLPNMAVVGEMVARNQGWVEGALESVDAVVTAGWINGRNKT